jgi:hypothetical protein
MSNSIGVIFVYVLGNILDYFLRCCMIPREHSTHQVAKVRNIFENMSLGWLAHWNGMDLQDASLESPK